MWLENYENWLGAWLVTCITSMYAYMQFIGSVLDGHK